MVRYFMLQMLIVLFPVYIYQITGFERITKGTRRHKIVIGLFAGCTASLALSFPVVLMHDFFFDLRNVPLIVATLYGGVWAWLPATLIQLAVRTVIGGPTAYISYMLTPIISALVFFVRQRFVASRLSRKLTIVSGLLAVAYISVVYSFFWYIKFGKIDDEGIKFIILAGLINPEIFIAM